MSEPGTRKTTQAFSIEPHPGIEEFDVSAEEINVDAIGGYPVRNITAVTGDGTLRYRDAYSEEGDAGLRTATLDAGESIGPGQITSILGTDGGTTGITRIRVGK